MRTAVTIYRCVRVSAAANLLHTQAMFGLRADMTRAHDACCRNFLSMRYVCDSAFAMECGAHTGLRTCARLPPQVSARSRSGSGSGSGSLFISCVRRRTQYQPHDYLSRALAMHVRSHNVGNYGGFTIFWSVCPALGTSFEASSMTTNLLKKKYCEMPNTHTAEQGSVCFEDRPDHVLYLWHLLSLRAAGIGSWAQISSITSTRRGGEHSIGHCIPGA